ncbi:MAG: M3 family oligoendopeptidase [Crocinitomicaceae bacterium]
MRIDKPIRTFLPNDLAINEWSDIESYFNDLLTRELNDADALKQWLQDHSELEAILEEDLAWRYIKMTIDTTNEAYAERYKKFVTDIQPQISPVEDKLNKKLVACPFIQELTSDDYMILFKRINRSIELFREENIPLQAKLSEESQKFGALSAAQTIEHNGETITMQKAALFLKETEESVRKEVFEKIAARRREDIAKFDDLFNKLLELRHQVAINAGFENYRDYKLAAMCRFDYDVNDCEAFHSSIKELIVPIVKKIQQKRLDILGKDSFKPWDLDVDPEGKAPLKPFKTGDDLLNGTVAMFNRIDPYFGECLATMNEMNHLDLESKAGKSPGGYNYPLYEIGVPFIFMNAVGSQRDLVTMVHEGGHAIHSFLSRDLKLTGFKNLPSEVAELASMSMELLSMEEWYEFYSDKKELNRAKREQLESLIKILPWIAQVDEFQHWLYVNYSHTEAERTEKWNQLSKEYGTGLVDWSGFEDIRDTSWQRQLHIFEVPFYYIEYGIAQLGAIGVWKNSLDNKTKAINDYKEALKLAYTKSIPEIYSTANVEFNFGGKHIAELANFVDDQLNALQA